jgi:Fe-Mn family superoxide dismutase
MKYEPKNFNHLLGIKGLSDGLLKTHFSLYQGYVANTNKMVERLNQLLQDGNTETPDYGELKRRFGWEFNGMRLHEYYFGNLTKDPAPIDERSSLFKKLVNDFGGFNRWEKDFEATGALRGIGWAVLSYDSMESRLFNVWINEHNAGQLSGAVPLLIMDVFEHAYIIDYGIKRGEYIEVFLRTIDWNIVDGRFQAAQSNEGRRKQGIIHRV